MKKLVFTASLLAVLFSGCSQKSSDCSEPDKKDILNEAQLLIETGEKVTIYSESLLGTLDTIELFPGSFSNKNKDYLGMCYSFDEHMPCMSFNNLPPPYETANYLLLKLSCHKGKWNIDWAAQENKLEQKNIIDIDGDGINEIIFRGNYVCNGGMIYGYYYIAKFENNELVNIYEKEPIVKIALLPNPNLELAENDILTLDLTVELIDVNSDGVKELIEKTKTVVYKGGNTKKEILKKALITNKIDTLFFQNNKFIKRER